MDWVISFLAAVGLAALALWTRAAFASPKLTPFESGALWLAAIAATGAVFGFIAQIGCLLGAP